MTKNLHWQDDKKKSVMENACANLAKIEYQTQNLNIFISFFVFMTNLLFRQIVISLCERIGFKTKTFLVFYERKIILFL